VNLMPLSEGENISVYLRVPENEEVWDKLDIMFATSMGTVRRNKLTDFQSIRKGGLIAMKLEDGEKLVSVKIAARMKTLCCRHRWARRSASRSMTSASSPAAPSTGVRGIKLSDKKTN
jgi:DNA gyrase subunit A